MTGVMKSLIARPTSTHPLFGALTLHSFYFILFGGLLGVLFAGCGGKARAAGTSGSNGFVETVVSSCSDVCDISCAVYSPSACTGTDATTPTSGTTGTDTTVGSCSDSADPSCVGYDLIGSDGGGSGGGGDGACTGDSCGSGGDPTVGGPGTGGDPGSGGDVGNGGDGGGDPGDGGGDPSGGIVHPGNGTHPSVAIDSHVRPGTSPVVLTDDMAGFSRREWTSHHSQDAAFAGGQP